MKQAPRAVFLSPIAPAMTGNGLAMRMGQFAEALAKVGDLTVIVVPTAGDAGLGNSQSPFSSIEIDAPDETHFSLLSRIADPDARLEAFRAYGKPSLARRLSAPVLAEIARPVETLRPDLVHIGRSYLLPCAEILPSGVIRTLDLDEDDLSSFAGQARLARIRGEFMLSRWLEQEGLACDQLIARWGRRFRKVFVASLVEKTQLALRHPGLPWEVVENSVEIPRRRAKRDDGETLLFLGALGYGPNVEGIGWFCDAVLPRLRGRLGGRCRLLIAGGSGDRSIAALAHHPRVAVLGRVGDVGPLYRRATLALAPLRSGGGTRIKLLEAAAHATASVSTDLATSGIDWQQDAAGWRGRSALEFAEACETGLANAAERDRRAARRLDWVMRNHSRGRVIARLAQSFFLAMDRRPADGQAEGTLN
jgi:glycosyltransferase involved in cell wall biosynthesis